MGLGRAPCHFLTPEVQRVNGPVLENPALCNTWRIWAPHCLGGSESPWQRGHPTHTHRTLSLLPVTPGPPQALPGLPHRNGELSMCLTLLCVCLQCPRHRGVTVRRLGPATTLLQEARCHLQGAASSRVSHPVTGERALYHVASAAGGAARSLAGGGCRPGVLHGCRPGELHGHWPGEGAGQGSCTVTGRGRVQVGVLEGPGCGCDSFPGGLENVLMPQKGDRARRALGQPERNLDTGLWA
ncbi:unnamed protein product [Natator depressus]